MEYDLFTGIRDIVAIKFFSVGEGFLIECQIDLQFEHSQVKAQGIDIGFHLWLMIP